MPIQLADNRFASFRRKHPFLHKWVQANRVALLLFALLWGTFAYFYQSTQQNEAARFDQTRAITQDHQLAIDNYWWNSADVIRYAKKGGSYIYPNKAPGTTLAAVPVFWLLTHALKPFVAIGLPEWIYWHLVAYLTILLTIGLISALAAVAIYKLLLLMTGEAGFSVFAVVAVWLGTMAFPFSTLFFSHQLAAALLAIAFYLLFALRQDSVGPAPVTLRSIGDEGSSDNQAALAPEAGARIGRDAIPSPEPRAKLFPRLSTRSPFLVCVAGACMGFSLTTEYPTALLVGVLSLYGLWVITRAGNDWKLKRRLLAALVGGLIIGSGFLVCYNIAAFGKVFYVPYEAYANTGSSFPVYARGFLGLRWPGFAHFLQALAAIMIKPPIGMLYLGVERWRVYASSPVLWLVLPGMVVMLWRRKTRPEGLVVAANIVLYVLFLTSYGNSIYDWSGAAYIGPRHLVPLLPFLALPLYYGARKLRFIFYPLLAVSVFYMLLATAIEPRVPFPFDNPARDSFLPDYLHARLAQNTDALFDPQHRKLTEDSTAFNLAKLARVPRAFQLAPLMLWWLGVGGALLFAAAPQPEIVQHSERAGGVVDESSADADKIKEPHEVEP